MEETKTLETIIETIISRTIAREIANKMVMESASERCPLKEKENKVRTTKRKKEGGEKLSFSREREGERARLNYEITKSV